LSEILVAVGVTGGGYEIMQEAEGKPWKVQKTASDEKKT